MTKYIYTMSQKWKKKRAIAARLCSIKGTSSGRIYRSYTCEYKESWNVT